METVTPENNPFFEHPKKPVSATNVAVNVVQAIILVAFALIIIYLFIATPNQVDGISMFPTFEDKQWVFTNRIIQRVDGTRLGDTLGLNYKHGDVIIIQKPDLPHEIIKRIIAMPGDTIAIKSGRVYLNSNRIKEEYLNDNVNTDYGTLLQEGDEILIPADTVFVMGDNRPDSLDSRFTEIGLIKKDWIIGKVILRLLPLNQITVFGSGVQTIDN